MKKSATILGILGLLILTSSQANAGIFSKFRGWGNNFWNNYGWGNRSYYSYPYNNYNNHCNCPHHGNGFFNSGSVTGFTPPINGGFYPSIGNYHNPMYGRFDHFPNGQINSLNSMPQQIITDYNSNVGTRTGVTILD